MKALTTLPSLFFAIAIFAPNLWAQETPEGNAAGGAEEVNMTEEEAEAEFYAVVEELGWTREGRGDMGAWADIDIPTGFRFTERTGSQQLMEMFGNHLTDREQGLIAPEDLDWFAIFEFNEVGYIKDDDQDDLDPDELLENYREGAKEESKMRGETVTVVGWAMPPTYNPETNNLEWGVEYNIEGNSVVNYQTHLLGREGEMEVTLVCDPDQLNELMPTYQNLLAGYRYKEGKSYAEFQQGDRIAEYGLAGLVAGGTLFAAAKLGLFAKLGLMFGKAWKVVVIGIIAAIAGLKSFFARLFGKEG